MRSRCSKILPDSIYELSEDNSEQMDSNPSLVESDAGSEELLPSKCWKRRICVIIQDEIDSISMRYGIEGELEITE